MEQVSGSAMWRNYSAFMLALALAMIAPSQLQADDRLIRIGVLRPGSPPDPLTETFRQALGDLGYVEGRNLSLEVRWADGKDERLSGLAAELVRLKVDVIVAGGGVPLLAASQATSSIPIVMPASTDPVQQGVAASLARPGGNVTGLTGGSEDLPGKWVELLKETLPKLSRVALLWDPAYGDSSIVAAEVAAQRLKIRLHVIRVSRPEDLEVAFANMRKNRAEAIIVLSSAFFYARRAQIVSLAARYGLPTLYHQREFVIGSGGLMSYGPDFHDMFRRAAGYVDKILKGAKPEDTPIEQPTKFEFVINLSVAKTLGVTIPQSVLLRADEVIR
jgi:putative ABC transport system substrate-binding protein